MEWFGGAMVRTWPPFDSLPGIRTRAAQVAAWVAQGKGFDESSPEGSRIAESKISQQVPAFVKLLVGLMPGDQCCCTIRSILCWRVLDGWKGEIVGRKSESERWTSKSLPSDSGWSSNLSIHFLPFHCAVVVCPSSLPSQIHSRSPRTQPSSGWRHMWPRPSCFRASLPALLVGEFFKTLPWCRV